MVEPSPAGAHATATVITFPPSLDCALARFLLAYYGVPYVERRHTIIFTFPFTLWHGGTLDFPLLFGGGYPTLSSVQGMIDAFDPRCPAGRGLVLTGADHDAVAADRKRFHVTLGTAIVAFAYFHLLPHRAIMIRPLTDGTPAFEVCAVRLAYPLFAGFISRGLDLTASGAQHSLAQIRTIVQSVTARLADGRRYLVGNRFSLSDMTFANALAPLVLPPEYGAPLPTYAEMPPDLQAVVREMQASPAGQFALRMYRDHKKPAP
jgi:glutathione S-transferase